MAPQRTARPSVGRPLSLSDLTLEDLESVRLVLRGSSVIDWHRLDFKDEGEVDRFLRVNEFNPSSEEDMTVLEELRHDAIDYLARNFAFSIPDEVAEEAAARDLLLMASRRGPHRAWACVTLKVMHIINHLAGRELMVRLPISDDAVFRATELKVMQVVEELRASGYPIEEFEWSRKPKDSLITKLLAKRSTLAAKIYDKLRFRLLVPDHSDLLPIMAALTRQLVPFNYVIPGATVNHLLPFDDVVKTNAALQGLEAELQNPTPDELSDEDVRAPLNEFSSIGYKIINFVADLPIRVEAIAPGAPRAERGGHVVFVMTEFQLADKKTSDLNERGESNHDAYKARQYDRVRVRLMRGEDDE